MGNNIGKIVYWKPETVLQHVFIYITVIAHIVCVTNILQDNDQCHEMCHCMLGNIVQGIEAKTENGGNGGNKDLYMATKKILSKLRFVTLPYFLIHCCPDISQ